MYNSTDIQTYVLNPSLATSQGIIILPDDMCTGRILTFRGSAVCLGKSKHGSLAIKVANGCDGIHTYTLCMRHTPFHFTPNKTINCAMYMVNWWEWGNTFVGSSVCGSQIVVMLYRCAKMCVTGCSKTPRGGSDSKWTDIWYLVQNYTITQQWWYSQ